MNRIYRMEKENPTSNPFLYPVYPAHPVCYFLCGFAPWREKGLLVYCGSVKTIALLGKGDILVDLADKLFFGSGA